MRKSVIALALILMISISNHSYSQLWKQYSDSAKAFNDQKNTDTAIQFYIKAKEDLKKDSGETKTYVTICDTIGFAFFKKKLYTEAEPFLLESIEIRKRIEGKNNLAYVKSISTLAIVSRNLAKYQKAESLFLEAKQVRENILGKNNMDYTRSCYSLGLLYNIIGEYKKAEILFLEAKEIRKNISGKNNIDYAQICNALGNLYSDMFQYEKAEPLYLESRQILKNLGEDYAFTTGNLAILYKDLGQYEKAESLFLEVIKIVGKGDPDYAGNCNGLANLYKDIGQYEKAESFYLEAKLIWSKTNNEVNYALSCNNLANLYIAMGLYEKAEPLHKEAMEIRKKLLGTENPAYAMSCNSLAALYFDIGKYKKAEPLLLKANQIWYKVYGKENQSYRLSCKNLANAFWIAGNTKKALEYFIEAINSQNAQINKIFDFTSESEKQSYLSQIGTLNDKFFSFNYSSSFDYHSKIFYDVSLSNRNLILSSSQQLRVSIYKSDDTTIKNKHDKWTSLKEQLSFWFAKPIAERPAYIKDLEEEANTLEKDLTRSSSAFKNQQNKNEITWKNIQQNLKPNEAAVEFIDFNFYNGKRYTDSTYYIALLLRKDKPEPELIKLFEKKQLDSLLIKKGNDENKNITSLYSSDKSIYNLVWKPMEKSLKGINKIYFAPSGNLHTIAFAALPIGNNKVLSDNYQLVELNTTASVTNQVRTFINTTDNINLYGGVQYDADSTALKQVVNLYASNKNKDNVALRSVPDDLERGSKFNYLPGTETEIENIKDQSFTTNNHVNTLSGVNATEESFKALNGKSSPAVLHVATHGFFFPDPKQEKDKTLAKFETSGKVFKQSDNPLFRSGLLFAGANYAWVGKPVEGIEDGILTAYEVSNMYLPNTKLVVLSACETALGDIQGSEGVYGLQRSFKIAGVQNLVMSLWKVPDAATAEFMQVFYKNMFAKQPISDAFYRAQTTMKIKYRDEPYKWAAWVLVR